MSLTSKQCRDFGARMTGIDSLISPKGEIEDAVRDVLSRVPSSQPGRSSDAR